MHEISSGELAAMGELQYVDDIDRYQRSSVRQEKLGQDLSQLLLITQFF